jgi:hypothetical protein
VGSRLAFTGTAPWIDENPMNRNELHELASHIASSEMFAAVGFVSFLVGAKRSAQFTRVLIALRDGSPLAGKKYQAPLDPDQYGGLTPWEIDSAEAQKHLQFLIGRIPEGDLYPAYRFLQYLHNAIDNAETERWVVDTNIRTLRQRLD